MNDKVPPGGAQSDEERAKAILEQLKSVHAFDLAYEMMVGLVSFGYQKLGLTEETRPLRDLSDARLAIELLRATLDVIEREEGQDRTRDLHGTLAQMQLSYARAVQLAGSPAVAKEKADAVADEPARAASSPEPADEPEEAAAPEAAAGLREDGPTEPAVQEPAAGEPAVKKTDAKKPAAKKTGAKKPATKKPPGAKKPRGGAPGDA